MPAEPTKADLKEELVRLLTADLEQAERAQHTAHEAATHEESRAESDKDTRAVEQSYLARGQAKRVEELRAALARVQAMAVRDFDEGGPIALGARVTVEEHGGEHALFIAPARGGTKLPGDAQVVTPGSPLGNALLGKHEGDDCEVKLAQKVRALTIVRVE